MGVHSLTISLCDRLGCRASNEWQERPETHFARIVGPDGDSLYEDEEGEIAMGHNASLPFSGMHESL